METYLKIRLVRVRGDVVNKLHADHLVGEVEPVERQVVTTGGLVTVDVLESDYLSSDTDNIDPFDAESGVRERERELRSLMPPLAPANGRPIVLSATVGSITMLEMPGEDPRVQAISHGFPISVHPLRLPNSRALFSNLSSVSVVDYGFVRLAGLLHEMVPLRHEIDKVEIKDFHSDFTYVVYGYVTILFDAGGFEFEEKCWVVNLMRASQFVDLIVGMDWLTANAISTSFSRKGD
ncbi:hypothetical protein PHLCEN_2v9597 [Hermanssonia centrifuga]|uniref:Uncharacterized protein n=1 Tax=Hermanssonia centrifuga TaxID=98765 RepID=A0A2R6NQB2_9APHY|nr:hypothetical protein PHLCEN_2v9597 [Hermanssonia centrifuga]